MQNSDDSPSGPDDRAGPGVDPTEATFEDWIDHVADAEGVPPEAVRARLMSSYWILDELARHLEDASFEDLSDELAAEEFTATESEEEDDRIRTILEELVEDARSMEPRQPPDPEQPSWERLVEIVQSLDGFDEPDRDEPAAEADPPAPEQAPEQLDGPLRELHDQIAALQERMADNQDDSSSPVEDLDGEFEQFVDRSELEGVEQDLRDRLSDVEATLETVEAQIEELDATLSDQTEDVSDIDQRTGTQSERIEALQDTLSTLAEKLQTLDGHLDSNHDRLGQLESTIDAHANHLQELEHSVSTHETELENAEKVLRHLFGEVERLGDRTSVIASVLRDLQPLVAAHDDREQVDSLKEAAAEIGTRTAECESCGQAVDLGLLTSPACPHCETPAEKVRVRSGLLRSKPILETAQRTEEPEPGTAWGSELAAFDPDRAPEQEATDPERDRDG